MRGYKQEFTHSAIELGIRAQAVIKLWMQKS